jgi:hypothetical protein
MSLRRAEMRRRLREGADIDVVAAELAVSAAEVRRAGVGLVVVVEASAVVDDVPRRPGSCRKTLSMKRLTVDELAVGRLLYPEQVAGMPQTRAQCASVPRPCPYVRCKHHLFLDVADNGNIKINHPGTEVWDLKHSCALDVAELGGVTLEAVGKILNITRERVRQIEMALMPLLRRRVRREGTELELKGA